MGCISSKVFPKPKVYITSENDDFVNGSYPFMKKGLKLYCLHQIASRSTEEAMYKWRLANIVMAYPGNIVKIHFEGWSDANDIQLNLETDYERLAPIGLLSEAQISSGGKLTNKQKSIVALFVIRKTEEFDIKMHLQKGIINQNNEGNSSDMGEVLCGLIRDCNANGCCQVFGLCFVSMVSSS